MSYRYQAYCALCRKVTVHDGWECLREEPGPASPVVVPVPVEEGEKP